MFKKYLHGNSGQGMSEYLILVLLIAVGSIAAARSIGTTVHSKLDQIHSELQGVYFTSSHGKKGTSSDKKNSNSGSGGVFGSVFGNGDGI